MLELIGYVSLGTALAIACGVVRGVAARAQQPAGASARPLLARVPGEAAEGPARAVVTHEQGLALFLVGVAAATLGFGIGLAMSDELFKHLTRRRELDHAERMKALEQRAAVERLYAEVAK